MDAIARRKNLIGLAEVRCLLLDQSSVTGRWGHHARRVGRLLSGSRRGWISKPRDGRWGALSIRSSQGTAWPSIYSGSTKDGHGLDNFPGAMQPCVGLFLFAFICNLFQSVPIENNASWRRNRQCSWAQYRFNLSSSSNFIFLLNAYQQIQTSASKLHFFHVLNTGDVPIEREQTPVWPDPP